MDVTGKVFIKKYLSASLKTELDIRGVSSGIYFLKVETESGVFVKKVVKE